MKFKVRTLWEAHKNLLNLPHVLYIYIENVQTMKNIFSNFVYFSESPNFKEQEQASSVKAISLLSHIMRKVSRLIQKVLIHFSYPQTDEPNYFPHLTFEFMSFKGLINTCSCSEGSNMAPFSYLILQSSFWYLLMWHDLSLLKCHNFKF